MPIFILSCKFKSNKVVKGYYEGGNLMSEITYTDDTVKEGRAIGYYKSGQISIICYYKDDVLDSLYEEYYPNGKLKERGCYYKGIPVGSFRFYFQNGQLRRYNALDYRSDVFYVMLFDSLGRKIKDEGLAVSYFIASPTAKGKYSIGDYCELWFSIATPPGYLFPDVTINVFEKSVGLIDSYTMSRVNTPKVVHSMKFNEAGMYQVSCISYLNDTAKSILKVDTAFSEVIIVR